MDNFRGLLDIRSKERVLNRRIRDFCGVRKGINERINDGVLRWFVHVERIENGRITRRVYVGE